MQIIAAKPAQIGSLVVDRPRTSSTTAGEPTAMVSARNPARVPRTTLWELGKVARVAFAKVSEYQARGIVHFHAAIRIDGPEGPATVPPSWATADLVRTALCR